MSDPADIARDAAKNLPRFTFVVGVVSAVLVLQLLASAVSGLLARRDGEEAVHELVTYFSDSIVTRTLSYVDPAQSSVAQVVDMFDRDRAPDDLTLLSMTLYETMHLHAEVEALFVAFPDGSFVHVRRMPNGYERIIVHSDEDVTSSRQLLDRNFTQVLRRPLDVAYDPRRLAWWIDASAAPHPAWTDPYTLEFAEETGVSTVTAVRDIDGDVEAVVGADVVVAGLSGFLDTLPFTQGSDVLLIAADGEVIAAPESFAGAIAEALSDGKVAATADDLGIALAVRGEDTPFDEPVLGHTNGMLTYEVGFPRTDLLPWIVYIRTDEAALSPGIASFQRTSLWGSAAVAILVLAASFLIYQLRHPIDELHTRASTDDLTRLANRYEFRRRGQVIVDDAYERAEPVCVAMFDLDDFKLVNDSEGHAAGDRALKAAADALREATGPDDVVARFGGDEFVVVRLVGDEAVPYQAVERIRDHVERGINKRRRVGEQLGITAGFALSGPDYRDLRSLAQSADAALVAGKRVQKGQTHTSRDAAAEARGRYPAPEVQES